MFQVLQFIGMKEVPKFKTKIAYSEMFSVLWNTSTRYFIFATLHNDNFLMWFSFFFSCYHDSDEELCLKEHKIL
jgi:hypothetical protein